MPPRRRGTGDEWDGRRVLEALSEILPDAGEGTLERIVREIALVEWRRGRRNGMLSASFRVTDFRERTAIRQEARGLEPETDGPGRPSSGPPSAPW